jgi:hypothetical protein
MLIPTRAGTLKLAVSMSAAAILICGCGGPLVMVKTANKTADVLECESGSKSGRLTTEFR